MISVPSGMGEDREPSPRPDLARDRHRVAAGDVPGDPKAKDMNITATHELESGYHDAGFVRAGFAFAPEAYRLLVGKILGVVCDSYESKPSFSSISREIGYGARSIPGEIRMDVDDSWNGFIHGKRLHPCLSASDTCEVKCVCVARRISRDLWPLT